MNKKFLLMLIAFLTLATIAHARQYLFVYFEGTGPDLEQEHLRFALSKDAVMWRALNHNRPVVSSDTICSTLGLRDPHILRGEDGKTFYIVATDMSALRNGWTTNPGIVMMRSTDLIHWTHHLVNLPREYPAFSDARYVWAPQTIWDRRAKKYLVYFTYIPKAEPDSMVTYAAYANDDFSGFASEPRQLFSAKGGSIDNDIIYNKGTYHLFFKGNERDSLGRVKRDGIRVATSKSLWGPWKEQLGFVDAYADTNTSVEGSCVFPIDDGKTWMLIYDLFASRRYEYQTSTSLKDFSAKPGRFDKDFFPRHGTVIQITDEEANRLKDYYCH